MRLIALHRAVTLSFTTKLAGLNHSSPYSVLMSGGMVATVAAAIRFQRGRAATGRGGDSMTCMPSRAAGVSRRPVTPAR